MPGQPSANPFVTIDTTSVVVVDNQGAPSLLIINRAQGMTLNTTIQFGGAFKALFGGHNYTVRFFAESLTGEPNAQVGAPVPGIVPPGAPDVPVALNVAGATLPADGLYKITVVVHMPGLQVTAFNEGNVIEIATGL